MRKRHVRTEIRVARSGLELNTPISPKALTATATNNEAMSHWGISLRPTASLRAPLSLFGQCPEVPLNVWCGTLDLLTLLSMARGKESLRGPNH